MCVHSYCQLYFYALLHVFVFLLGTKLGGVPCELFIPEMVA